MEILIHLEQIRRLLEKSIRLFDGEKRLDGLENFKNIFKDDLFTTAFGNTIKFVLIIVPLQTLGALGLALLINKVTVCKKYFKVAFFIPVVMSLAVVSNLWMQIYSPEGILNTILSNFGIDAQPFIYGANQAPPFHCTDECLARCWLSDDYFSGWLAGNQSGTL